MQRLDSLDKLNRKRNRRFECHPAQRVRCGKRSTVEAKPCVRVGERSSAVDEIRNPDCVIPKVYGCYAVFAESQDLALDSEEQPPFKLAFQR